MEEMEKEKMKLTVAHYLALRSLGEKTVTLLRLNNTNLKGWLKILGRSEGSIEHDKIINANRRMMKKWEELLK